MFLIEWIRNLRSWRIRDLILTDYLLHNLENNINLLKIWAHRSGVGCISMTVFTGMLRKLKMEKRLCRLSRKLSTKMFIRSKNSKK